MTACICGHRRGVHLLLGGRLDRAPSPCQGSWERDDRPCGCEGWQLPAAEGECLVFGLSRLPRKIAESAPMWPPLAGHQDDAP